MPVKARYTCPFLQNGLFFSQQIAYMRDFMQRILAQQLALGEGLQVVPALTQSAQAIPSWEPNQQWVEVRSDAGRLLGAVI